MATSSFLGRSAGFSVLDRKTRPRVSIVLAGQRGGGASYTTLDRITGEVRVTVNQETAFDKLDIAFEGSSEIILERPGAIILNNSKISHPFLKLEQPIHSDRWPKSNILRPGSVYRFPFVFVVPERLLPSSCSHPKRSLSLQQAHASLPPTLGDLIPITDNHSKPIDDFAPPMTRIFYLLKAVIKKTPIEADDEEIIAAVGKKIRIIPTVEEEPPLSLADNCIEYRTKEETTIKQGLRRNKQGQLTLSALQPRPLQLELSSNNTTQSTGTVTTLDLRFVPETDEQPPQLNTLTSKIKALTFLSGEPLPDYPTNLTIPDGLKFNKYTYQRTVPLLSLRVTSVRWQRHDCHCSGLKLSPSPDVFYTTSIVIPTNLPDGKAFVPTFHSCFVSRVYALELSLSYFTLNRLEKTASLRVPVQITCRRGLDLDI